MGKMGEKSNSCKTKYPIVMLHGAALRDRKLLNYWGRIPRALKKNGCVVYYGNQDSWATVENNAYFIKDVINKILKENHLEKVNLITHSKGGLEARYMISSLEMESKIASLTTIATPHRGSKTMDIVCKLPKFLFEVVSWFADLWFKILGDNTPDFHNVCGQLTTIYANQFNKDNPDKPDVYYQSYAAIMKNPFSDMFLFVPYIIVKLIEGESDGLVTPRSAKWTNFKGVLQSVSNRGISHADEVDMRRMRLSKKRVEGRVHDICLVYVDIVSELKRKGF